MLVLYETAVGYAIFQVLKEKKFQKAEDVAAYFADGNNDPKAFYKLLAFTKFNDTKEALTAATSNLNGKANETLMATINKVFKEGVKETLAVSDTSIGQIIKEEMDVTIPFIHGDYVLELIRGINAHASTLLGAVTDDDINAMRLGLAHSVSRYKLKFSPDKVDTMIVHSVALLDEIDKQLNNYVMRMKEWYGWHFPELAKLVPDAVAYSKLVTTVGFRNLYAQTDLSEILDREVEAEVKKLAEVSMGTEISDEDITNIRFLAEEIIEFTDYREKLNTYLRERMLAIAPNLTNIVGELVGARLIAHAGSLVNLAKHPASTVQILGAEKALFRALKTRKDTPKYGLIYHASIVSQCSAKNKGKMSRMLAAKAALGCRVDALSDESTCEVAMQALEKINMQMQRLENTKISTGALKTPVKQESKQYHNTSTVVKFEAEDSSLPSADTKVTLIKSEPSLIVADGELQGEAVTTEKKKKKKKKAAAAEAAEAETPKCEKKKKKKRKADEALAEETEAPAVEKKKKKKKKSATAE